MMLLLLALAAQEPPPSCSTRASCDAAMTTVIRASDSDRDGRLSRAEWTAMGEKALTRLPVVPAEIERLRRDIAADFRAEDINGDGYLTHGEMLEVRLAAFPCLDSDGDGTISDEERERASRCAPEARR
jgi:Ca2+-binding EF-hand superfamily protein